MKKYLFLLVGFSFLVAQCTKDDSYLGDHTIAAGTITEAVSAKPVANVKMILYKCTYQVFGGSSCEIFDSTRTDAKGFFSFDFKHEKDYQYEIDAVPDSKKYTIINNGFPVEKGTYRNKINLILTPYSFLKLKIKNITPNDNSDKISVGAPMSRYIPDLYGNIDTIFEGKALGNQYHTIYWWVEKKGIKTNFSDKIYCSGHDTVTYQINY